MKSYELLEVIGETQDSYVLDAKAPKRKTTPVWVKWTATAACLCLILGLMIPTMLPHNPNSGGISKPGGTNPIQGAGNRPIAPYIQPDVNQIIVTHIIGGATKAWTVSGDDLDTMRNWANNLQYEILSAEAENPGNLNGNDIYRIEISEGDYPGFTYIIIGENEHYLQIEGYWYVVKNPTYPPISCNSNNAVTPGGNPGDWLSQIDPITASIAVFPDTEELKNVESATLTDIDEVTAYSFEKLGAYLPTHMVDGYHFAKASLYETTMKDGTKYYQLRVTFADGDISEADPTVDPKTGEQSKDAPAITSNSYMVWIMNYNPGKEYTIYSGDTLTEYIKNLSSNGAFFFEVDDLFIGFAPSDLNSDEVMAVVNSMH